MGIDRPCRYCQAKLEDQAHDCEHGFLKDRIDYLMQENSALTSWIMEYLEEQMARQRYEN